MQNTIIKLQSKYFVNSTCNATVKSNFLNLGIYVGKNKTKMYTLIFVIAFAKAYVVILQNGVFVRLIMMLILQCCET